MKKIAKGLMLAAAMGLVAPAVAQTTDDAKDTAKQIEHDTTKTAREHKPGGETASDKAADASDQAKSTTASTKKKARKASKKAKKSAKSTQHSAEKKADDLTK